jgi:hypothetical protein
MGKRELLLIGGFAVIGVMVYYLTAPAAAPGQQGFSVGKLIDHARREIRGNLASAELKTSTTTRLNPGTTELRFETGTALTIVGEDRDDVVTDLSVWSSGYDDMEAKRYAAETKLNITVAGNSLIFGMSYPKPAEQRASLALRVPRKIAIRIQPTRSKLEISDVASVELVESRGPVTLRGIDGRLVATHRGGILTLESIATLKLSTRGSNVVLRDVRGEAMLQMQGGELRGEAIAGPLEIESNGTRIVLEDLVKTRKPVKLNAVGGSLSLTGVTTDLRIDGRNTSIDVVIDKPAPVAIYTEGEEATNVTLPAGGFALDALAMDNRLSVPDGLFAIKSTEKEQRASGVVGGGGPTITLRSSRGEINIRLRRSDT